jgi:hypothetical protein
MPLVLDHIAAHLDTGQPADLDRLQELYARRHLDPASAPDVRPHLAAYLGRLREMLSAHPTYGPLLLARDVQSLTMALRNLHEETRRRFDDLDSTLR